MPRALLWNAKGFKSAAWEQSYIYIKSPTHPPTRTILRLFLNVLSRIQAGNPPGMAVSCQIPRVVRAETAEDDASAVLVLPAIVQEETTALGTA